MASASACHDGVTNIGLLLSLLLLLLLLSSMSLLLPPRSCMVLYCGLLLLAISASATPFCGRSNRMMRRWVGQERHARSARAPSPCSSMCSSSKSAALFFSEEMRELWQMALQEENDPSSSSSSFSPPPLLPPPPVLCLRFQGWHRPSDGDVPGRKDPHRALVPQSSLSGKVPSPREMALALLIAAQILVGICSAKRRDPVERIPPIPQEASTDPSLYVRFVPMEIRSTLARPPKKQSI